MNFGLYIIGDEILSGKRADKHLTKVIEILNRRGLQLSWAQYLGDDPDRLTAAFKTSLASHDVVLSCGGIGATPDDHTRQSAAAALGEQVVLHPEAERLINERIVEMNSQLTIAENQQRMKMGEFPESAAIIPNPFNKIPGFSVKSATSSHYFMPGFPVMAWPMIEWVLDNEYRTLFNKVRRQEKSVLVYEAPESALTPLMVSLEKEYPLIKVFSLPSVGEPARGKAFARRHVELGVKGDPTQVKPAFVRLKAEVAALGYEMGLEELREI